MDQNRNGDADITALCKLLLDTAELEKLENMTNSSPNIFSILKVESKEIPHSNFLAWLISPSENHGLNQLVIESLLKWYAETHATDDDAVSLLLADGRHFRVLREWQGIDLLAISDNDKIVFAIENKVFSTEHSKQLQRYFNAVTQHYFDYKRCFLYLTLEGDEPPYMEDIWHPIGYEDIASMIEEAIEKAKLSPEGILLINHYIDAIRRLVSMENPEIKELCNKIYQKHKTAFDLIFRNVDIDERPELNALREWVTEWKEETDKRKFTRLSPKWYEFSTPGMNAILPPVNGQIAYKYFIDARNYPFRVVMELQSAGIINTDNFKNADAIVRHIENRSVLKPKNAPKDKLWTYHQLKKWQIKARDLDKVNFYVIADKVKEEMNIILNKEIPNFESEMAKVVSDNHE